MKVTTTYELTTDPLRLALAAMFLAATIYVLLRLFRAHQLEQKRLNAIGQRRAFIGWRVMQDMVRRLRGVPRLMDRRDDDLR